MNRWVLLEAVPDLKQAHVSKRQGILIENAKRVIDPLSGRALEMALRLREQQGGTITAVMIAGSEGDELLRQALAAGVDRAIRLAVPDFLNGFIKARLLKKLFETSLQGEESAKAEVQWFLGEHSLIRGFGELAGRLSAALTLPCYRGMAALDEMVPLSSPAIIAVSQEASPLRIPNALAIMKAQKRVIEVLSLSDLGVEAAWSEWQEVQKVVRTFAPEEGS